MKLTLVAFVFTFEALLSGTARGAVIFSNLVPAPDPYSSAWAVFGPLRGGGIEIGSAFTPTAAATLDSIEVALWHHNGPNLFNVFLMSGTNGLPDQVLETFDAPNVSSVEECTDSCAFAVTLLTSSTHTLLHSGAQYWIVAAGVGDATGAFVWNQAGDTGIASRASGGAWKVELFPPPSSAGAFAVNGTPATAIPEPSGPLVLVIAGPMLWAHRRRSRRSPALHRRDHEGTVYVRL